MKDANGNATVLAADEGITVTTTDTALTISNPALAKGEENSKGAYIVAVKPAATTALTIAAGTAIVTLTGNGLLPANFTTNTTVSKKAATTLTAAIIT